MLKQEIIEKIMQKSISLEKYGINDLAWTREDAKKLINAIMKDNIGILGGDAYDLTLTQLVPLSDNWSCEPTETESNEEYYLRSKFNALNYIDNYPKVEGENIIFSIIFTEKIV